MSTSPNDPLEIDYIPPKVKDNQKHAISVGIKMLRLIAGLVVLFVIWATFFSIDEVTRGQGKVISSKETQIINSLEGGIVRDIHVEEGATVQEGQVLISIDKTLTDAEFQGTHSQYMSLLAAKARLQAQLDGKDFVVPEIVQKEAPAIAEQEKAAFAERQMLLKNTVEIADNELIQRQQELAQSQSDIDNGKETLRLMKEELALLEPLLKQQLIGKRDVLHLQRDIQTTQGKIQTAVISIPRLQAAVAEAKDKKEQAVFQLNVDDNQKLQDISVRLADTQTRMKVAQDKLTRTEIRAPMKGTIKDVKVKTVGQAIQPAQDLMEIVPFEDMLIIEAKISPSDVGFVHKGLKGRFKATAYDSSIYGDLPVEVIDVSADTLEDKSVNPPQVYYRAYMRSKTNYIMHKGKKLPIIPGMAGEVDVVTGYRSVMTFLAKPFIKGAQSAFGER